MVGDREIIVLALASAIVTANAYYIHPIIGDVAREFGVSDGLIGIVPAMNQIALALGVLLLLPLGDRVNNRSLVTLCLSVQVAALATMAVTGNFALFVTASTILGFFTVTPYLLPAYASRRVAPSRLGYATALLVRKKLRAWNQLKNARVYLKTGQLEMGFLLLNHSIRAHPDLAESWYTRGVANFRLERYEEACQDWKKACGLEVGWCLGEEYAIAGKICP